MNRGKLLALLLKKFNYSDLKSILDIQKNETRPYWSERQILDVCDDIYVLKDKTITLGFIVIKKISPDAEIHNLIIKDNYRNQGLGKVLIRLILGALEESITRIYLEVAANNEPALRLYRALGFTEIGRRQGYYSGDKLQSDAITMRLDV